MKYLLSLLSVVVLLSACKKKDGGCDAKPGTTSASAQEEAMVTEYIAANNIDSLTRYEGHDPMYPKFIGSSVSLH